MTTFNHHPRASLGSLIEAIERYAEAGIDPTFDSDMEELERRLRASIGVQAMDASRV